MEDLKAPNDLDKYVPDFFFFDVSFSFLVVTNLLKHISIISIFHYKTIYKLIYITVTYHKELLLSSIKASL